MPKTDEYWGRARPPDEEENKKLKSLRKRIFLGGLGWMVFATAGGYLFERTRLTPFLNLIIIIWWFVVAWLVIKYTVLFFKGKPKKKS
ncbi:MAG TPA: hypothetical protein VGX48_11605 [Pyrinomonadaceae bacterium]|jgi:hypothetical protein|nr:hypothetical protein [Pyrinomonadaceae bacterium]